MGENEAWAEPGGPLPNGLLPGAGRVMRALDIDRWSKAEERTAELIACIQPNQFSEERRNAVADYVQRLIMKCFPCQVCTFGSVPLKTYLPDGDIDLTAFSHDQNLKDSWANQVRDMLENEEKNENAEFHVKEVQYIQAEVKIIKCLVENIVVDISFNQVGGLCTLCFLDEVDNLINQNHLFKRSIILIKAWCYYESRILGAHHGLISTYALETLVLYIFHVFNNSFHGPLEVLYRFLEFFSNFDWDNFCVSLWGPVPISSLPDVTAEPPCKDSGELLLSKLFLDACSSVYAVYPGGQENNGQPFVSKHFNVIDPLRVNNNLGRSVSKGNFFRIRSAFAFGAKRLARLLDCAKENLTFEVNQFFLNTWERHGSGNRPDAPGVNSWRVNLSTPDGLHEIGNSNKNTSRNNVTGNSSILEMEDKGNRGRVSSQHGKTTPDSHVQSLKGQNLNILRVTDQNDEDQRDSKADHLVNDTQGRFLFARTRSSPELTANNRRKNLGPAEDTRNIPSQQSVDADEVLTTSGAMNQEEQDIVNMMASASLQGFNSQIHVPFNLNSAHHLPFSIPPSFLASMGYNQQNLPGFVPGNIPLIDPSFSNMQFPHGLVPPQLNHYFHSPSEASFERTNENFGSVEMNSEEVDNDFWQQEQDVCSSAGYDPENGNFEMLQSDDKPPQASVSDLKYVPPPRVSGSTRGQQKNTKEKRGSMRQNSSDSFPVQDEVYAEERSTSSRFSSAAHSNSLRSRTSSESSWDGSSVKTPKSTKQKQGKKVISADLSTDHGKGKIMSEHGEDDEQEWGSFPNVGPTETVERNSGSDSMMPFAPMLIRPGSRGRNDDNSGLIFYPTGPPIPFLTMLPVYNVPPKTSTSDEAVEISESGQNFSSEGFDHLDDPNLNSLRGMTTTSTTAASASETSEKKKPDILNGDFASHWQNLQFGRFCQNSRHHGPLLYHSPVMVPPVYLQGGRFPFDNPGRPVSTNMNLFSQLMTSYGQRVAPVGPIQSVSNRPPNMYQRYVDDMPRYRSGTGTYLPNPKVSPRDRHSSGNRRGNYSHDRTDNYNDREGNWNASKSRAALRRNQSDKSNSRADKSDRSWNSHRHESVTSYQSQNGPLTSNSSQDVPYSMHPLAAANPNGASNGPPVPPVVMLYPFDHNAANYGSHSEQLEFGSLGPVGLPGMDEQPSLNEGARARTFEDHRLHGSRSSPDQPSSPHHQRRI